MSPKPPSFRWAVLSDPGLRRSSNEDCYATREDVGLFMVADGMGGHVAGEVASRVAVEAIQAFIEETAGADKNRTWPFPFDPDAQPRRQSHQGRVPPRKPPHSEHGGRIAGPAGHGDDGLCLPRRHRSRLRRPCRRQPRVRAAQGRALADHTRSFLGRRAGPRRDDEPKRGAPAPLAQRRHARSVWW